MFSKAAALKGGQKGRVWAEMCMLALGDCTDLRTEGTGGRHCACLSAGIEEICYHRADK